MHGRVCASIVLASCFVACNQQSPLANPIAEFRTVAQSPSSTGLPIDKGLLSAAQEPTQRQPEIEAEEFRLEAAMTECGSFAKLWFFNSHAHRIRGVEQPPAKPEPWIQGRLKGSILAFDAFRQRLAAEHPDIQMLDFQLEPTSDVNEEGEQLWMIRVRLTSERVKALREG